MTYGEDMAEDEQDESPRVPAHTHVLSRIVSVEERGLVTITVYGCIYCEFQGNSFPAYCCTLDDNRLSAVAKTQSERKRST